MVTSSNLPARLEALPNELKELAPYDVCAEEDKRRHAGLCDATCAAQWLKRRLAALLVGAEPPADQWQPIETAPLMETVLLYSRGWRSPFVGKRNGDYGASYVDGDPGFQTYAQFWMPLPAPPGAASPRVGAPAEIDADEAAGIVRGLEDIKAGRVKTLEQIDSEAARVGAEPSPGPEEAANASGHPYTRGPVTFDRAASRRPPHLAKEK